MNHGIRPLLAHVYEPHRVSYPCFVQPKLNGVRALFQAGRFQSRDLQPFPARLLQHLAGPLSDIFDPSIILDGELYVHGWSLQRILAAVTPIRQEPTEDTLKVEYHVFDVVDYSKSFEERNEIRSKLYVYGKPVCCVQGRRVHSENQLNEMYAAYVDQGYEGCIIRLGDCPYTVPKQEKGKWHCGGQTKTNFLSDQDNRVWHMLKRKDWQDDEFDFVSINETIGELGEPGFQVWCKAKNGTPFKFGSGLTQAEVQYYLSHPPIGRKVKGKYLTLSSDGIPLNPTILAIL